MATNYGFSSDDDFDFEVKRTKRVNYDSDDWNFGSPEQPSYMRRCSTGDLIIEPGNPGQSSRSSRPTSSRVETSQDDNDATILGSVVEVS